jgi:drug/metabolite transporter (DMT)-like permease
MNWFLLAFLSTTLWSITAFLDKYLVSRYFQKSGMAVLIFFSAAVGLLLVPFILAIDANVLRIPPHDIFILIISGIFFVFAILPYYFVLREEDASLAVPYYQAIPVALYLLGLLFLHEQLTKVQSLASVLIIIGAIGLTTDFESKIKKIRWRTFGLMMLSVSLYSVNFFLFKFVESASSFWTTSFWEYCGFALVALALLAIGGYRRQIIEVFRVNAKGILAVNVFNELLNITAKIVYNYATLFAPLALVSVVGSTQPLVVLFLGAILTILLPKIFQENITRRALLQKLLFIIVILGGVFIINH